MTILKILVIIFIVSGLIYKIAATGLKQLKSEYGDEPNPGQGFFVGIGLIAGIAYYVTGIWGLVYLVWVVL